MDGSIKNIKDLVEALEKIEKGKILEGNSDLYLECQNVFKKLQISDSFNPNDIQKLLNILDNLPAELKTVDIGLLDVDAKKLDSKALNKQDLESLMDDYEKAKSDVERKVFERKIYERTGKKDVELFVKGQKEIKAKNIESLKKIEKIDPKLRGEIETKIEKVKQGMEEVKAEKIKEIVLEEKEYTKKELEKAVKELVENKNKALKLSKEIAKERAEIKVIKKADEIAQKTCEELKSDQVMVTEKTRVELRESILKSWENGDKILFSDELTKVVQRESVLKNTIAESEKFKQENLEKIVQFREERLEKQISYELKKNGVTDENLIHRYAEAVNELNNNSEVIIAETNRQEIYDFVESKNTDKSPGQIETSIDEAQFMAKNVIRSPGKFNKAIKDYNEIRELIGAEKLPKIKTVRVTEKMAALFKNNPKALRLLNGAQRTIGFLNKVNNFPEILLGKAITSKVGLKIIGKIGGETAVTFVKNAAMIIAKEGSVQGIQTILMGLTGQGSLAIEGGALSGTFFGKSLLGIQKLTGGITGKLAGIGKNFLFKAANFLKSTGGTMLKAGKIVTTIAGNIGAFVAALPEILIGAAAVIAVVLVCVIVGIFVYSLLQQNMTSAIVPPADMSNCVLASEYGGEINCNSKAPENTVAGLSKSAFVDVANRWTSGTNYAETCFNDTVNRALCKGINPTFALWVWLHESGASNYTSADDVEDFGMHSIPENENFNAQINAFLDLNDPAQYCINDSRVGGNYWLSFSIAFLNGKNDCDPDKKNAITGMTPREYVEEIKQQWGWFSSSPLPNSIKVSKGGQNCDTAFQAIYSGNANEVKDSEGRVWICTETSQSIAGPDYNANSPGLSGDPVDGECSVGEVVVPTKQCDPQWGSIRLNGGSCKNGKPGTICSAGCGPTSVSMLLRHTNGSLTPNNVIFSSGSAYANMGCSGSSLEQAKTELVKKFGSGAVTYDAVTQGCDPNAIAKWLCDENKVVMILANFYHNSSLELGGHFVLATGVRDGKIVVADPYYDVTDTPFDGTVAYGYAHDIRGCLLVDKTAVK